MKHKATIFVLLVLAQLLNVCAVFGQSCSLM
jgi:hypothetical protein